MRYRDTAIRVVISIGALALLANQIGWPPGRLDAASLGLAALAIVPWLSSVVESAKLPGGWEVKFREVKEEQERQRVEIEALRFVIENLVTDHELTHLRKLASGEPFPFHRSDSFRQELYRLIALGFVNRLPDHGVRSLFEAGDDVQTHLRISDRGRAYLRHRDATAGLQQ